MDFGLSVIKQIFVWQVFLVAVFSGQGVQGDEPSKKFVFGHWGGGLGVSLIAALNHLAYCEMTGLIPVAYWKGCLYEVPNKFNGKNNPWEYYFEPTSNLQFKQGDEIHSFFSEDYPIYFAYYKYSQEIRNEASRIFHKYVRVNQIVQSKIDRFYLHKMAGKKTIGIHIRGTDKISEEPPVSAQRMVAEALKYADKETQFLIATDELQILDELAELLGRNRVIYYDCLRSKNGVALHDISRRERNLMAIAQNGEDVVIEMMLLSKCDLLLRTLSSVSVIPLFINSHLKQITLTEKSRYCEE